MSCRRQFWPAAVLAVWLAPSALWAQYPGYPGMEPMPDAGRPAIGAQGTSMVRRKPTQLRMYLQLSAKGRTLPEALAKLNKRREAAAARLETLKADKKSIAFGSPSLSAAESSRQRQIEMLIRQQIRNRGQKAAKGLPAPPMVTVTATLVAGWPLPADPPEQLLLITQDLQERIRAADLAGGKAVEKLSPEEEEIAEEASQGMTAQNDGEPPPVQPGEPQFVFVAVLPKAEREKALAVAFARAKANAAELAKAAGVKLGPLVALAGGCSGDTSFTDEQPDNGQPNGRDFIRRFAAQQDGADSAERPNETVSAESTDPAGLKFTCHASVEFQLGN